MAVHESRPGRYNEQRIVGDFKSTGDINPVYIELGTSLLLEAG